jgi:hypothetical protein
VPERESVRVPSFTRWTWTLISDSPRSRASPSRPSGI